MSAKDNLQRIFGVITGLIGSTDPEDMSTLDRHIGKLGALIATLETIGDAPTVIQNPSQFTIVPGTCFGGKYTVERRMSETKHIYLCREMLFRDTVDCIQRDVVIKCTFLNSTHNSEMAHEQFKRAIQTTAVAVSDCPFSIPLLAAGELTAPDGTPFLYWEAFKCMACDAYQLRDIMGGEIPPFMIMHLAEQITTALVHYHSLGIVHRDIKPQNILCTWPKHELFQETWNLLVSFALADAQLVIGTAIDTPSDSHLRMILGTPQYMSPEQIIDPNTATARSDSWSLGVTLYQLATGEFPHPTVTSHQSLRVITTEQPKLFSDHLAAANYPPFFGELIQRSLSKNPAERPTSYDWFLAFRTQDTTMPLIFEPLPLLMLLDEEMEPPE